PSVAPPTPAPVRTPPPVASGCSGAPPTGTIAANFPVALAFAPDGRLFWAERSGVVRVWQNGQAKLFADVSGGTSTSGERGLLGLAISPTFASDHYVYAFQSLASGSAQQVVRWTDDCHGDSSNLTVVVPNLPAGGDCCHKGGRVAFGPDGKLYVTLGDEHSSSGQGNPPAQDWSSVLGKVLRYNPGGGVPADNPIAGNPAWAKGLRNMFGIAFKPDGTTVITNNGPSGDAGTPCGSCGDEVITIARGGTYQWPYCWGYSHVISPYTSCGGQPGPDYSAEGGPYAKNSPFFVAPTGITWVDGSGPAALRDHFVFCEQSPGHIDLLTGYHSAADTGIGGCSLDVKQGTDHAVYYSDSGHIYRQG
ncbi:MAG TPA: PQQ-dependent sugar dehydrogenase, partial [Candidatus Dormibacteraeota bacterium]|nr:PQQ-dependent sugar dehydrogenase [Candidatus Dormibacteraeota bacterium]